MLMASGWQEPGTSASLTLRIILQGVEGEVEDKRLRLKRQGSMLKTMFCATVRASRLVSAVRYVTETTRAIDPPSFAAPGKIACQANYWHIAESCVISSVQ